MSGIVVDGFCIIDDFDMFNGLFNCYNWKLVGKKEMYVVYNNYKLYFENVSYEDILMLNYVNFDLICWEKYCVWVVEVMLKEGFCYIY